MIDEQAIPVLDGMREVAPASEAWLVDVWGVIHNGMRAFEAGCEACAAFRETGGYVVLLTNAPRPAPAVVAQITRLGVPREAYDAVLTSGDVTRGLVQAWSDKRIHHLGPERDRGIFEKLGVDLATSIEADIVVCTGLFDDTTETPADYEVTLKGFKRRSTVMLCANPDLMVERGDKMVYCAGSLAAAYEAMDGEVVYAGKPHLPIYELAQSMVRDGLGREVAKDRLLAIGDGLRTDIKGAAAAGIRSVFIASGLHVGAGQRLSPAVVAELFQDVPRPWPIAALDELKW